MEFSVRLYHECHVITDKVPRTLRLLGRWTLFATPLMSVIGLNDETVGRLKEHVLCVATGGTVAVLYLDGLEV